MASKFAPWLSRFSPVKFPQETILLVSAAALVISTIYLVQTMRNFYARQYISRAAVLRQLSARMRLETQHVLESRPRGQRRTEQDVNSIVQEIVNRTVAGLAEDEPNYPKQQERLDEGEVEQRDIEQQDIERQEIEPNCYVPCDDPDFECPPPDC